MASSVGRHKYSHRKPDILSQQKDDTRLVRIGKLLVSDNEFGCDASSHGDHNEVSSDNMDDEIFDTLKTIQKTKFYTLMMSNDNNIIFESLLKIYLSSKHGYIDIGAILTKNSLYFLSAINYQTWIELKQRAKIDELIRDKNVKIDEQTAIKLTENLNLIDDININKTKIIPYFIGKSVNEIKFNLLSSKKEIKSLAFLFDLQNTNSKNSNFLAGLEEIKEENVMNIEETNQSNSVNDINYILIHEFYNLNILSFRKRNNFMQYLFNNIPYIEEKRKGKHSKLVKLQKYYNNHIIATLNDKVKTFWRVNKIQNDEMLEILPYYGYKIKYSRSNIRFVDLTEFNAINPVNLYETGYEFQLKRDEDDNGIIYQFQTNNLRYEWITHLDYVININKTSIIPKNEHGTNVIQTTEKLMNDFTDQTSENKSDEKFSKKYSFGLYLNYWEEGFENSVIPKYKTLKEELLNNKIAKISKNDYYELYEQCRDAMNSKRAKFITAKDIGINNRKFNVSKGSSITINHLICLKIYTDYGNTQKLFKQHCRKNNAKETMKNLSLRNREIAHWCRYLKESCTFFGQKMKKNDVFYTGLKVKLLFNSLKQHFECPLSVTAQSAVATNFCGDTGIILKLKAANSKTTYFNVSWLSHFQAEDERLIMGSSLRICDIIINGQSTYKYIYAIQMLEQIINGKFIDNKKANIEHALYSMIAHATHTSDSKLHDRPPKYILALFDNMIKTMKQQYKSNSLWINKCDLQNIEYQPLLCMLNGCGAFFEHFNFSEANINAVQQFEWKITDDNYIHFAKLKPRTYIKSQSYHYNLDDKASIQFHLECCSKYNDESNKCAIFFHLDHLPSNIKAVRIEFDLLCIKKPIYKNTMPPQLLSTEKWISSNNNYKTYCGFQTFSMRFPNKNTSMVWVLAVKVIDKINVDDHINIENLEHLNKNELLQICKSLVEKDSMNHVLQNMKDRTHANAAEETYIDIIKEEESKKETMNITFRMLKQTN